jgi:DNA-binding response OmpR family regulator
MKSLIFVVDNRPEVRDSARESLEAAGYSVRTFSHAPTGLEVGAGRPSLIVLAVKFQPHRAENSFGPPELETIPRILLLEDGSEEQRLIAVESGADDYLTRPLRPRELVARVQAVLHRSAFAGVAGVNGEADLVIDSWAMKLLIRGNEITTTTLEFRLVEYLARHRGQVLTRDFLLDAVWGNARFVNPRSVDACIRRIREKIEPDQAKPTMLKTIRGVGYRLDAIAAWQSAPSEGCGCPACRSLTGAMRTYA